MDEATQDEVTEAIRQLEEANDADEIIIVDR